MKLFKTKTAVAALGVVAMLAIPATSMADPLPPVNVNNIDSLKKDNTSYDQSNPVGQASSQISHNGWFISGNDHQTGSDQTTASQSRSDLVQALLGHTK
jgi:hypothetical protein